MTTTEIIKKLPFSPPYLFVDELHYVNDDGISGSYTFKEDLDFYKGHFQNKPVTPGAILVETMAQIGGTCFGIYLIEKETKGEASQDLYFATSYNVEFYIPVYPKEKVTVISKKIYARFGKLKYDVEMRNEKDEIVCKGIFSGMRKKSKNES